MICCFNKYHVEGMNRKNSPLISIIVPVYNIEFFLEKCIKSIINQTYKNIEIILVNDGSTDRSGDICNFYSKYDQRVKVINKKNGGLSDARNVGIVASSGKFIGFVDGDDWIEPDMYEVLYDAMQHSDADVAICGFYRNIGDRVVEERETGNTLIYSGKEILKRLLSNDNEYQICLAVWNRLYKRELIKDIRFPYGKSYEDIIYDTEVFYKCNRCVYVDKRKYHYLVGREGSIISSGFQKRRITDDILLQKKRTEFLESKNEKELAELSRQIMVHDMLLYYGLMCKDKKNYKKYIIDFKEELKKTQLENTWNKTGIALFLFKVNPKLWEIIIKIKYYKR